jgi:hypothetical protein
LNGANGDERVLHCYFGLDYYGRSVAAEEAEWHFVEIPSFAVAFSVAFVSFHIVQ